MQPIRLSDVPPGTPVLPPTAFQTPWRHLDHLQLAPGATLAPLPGHQPCWIVLEGQAELRQDPGPTKIQAPAALIPSAAAVLYNPGPDTVRLLAAAVALQGAAAVEPSKSDAIETRKLTWRDAIHGGIGRIATRHIWGPDDFACAWTFVDHAVLAADSSVGLHYHDALEECFIVLAGEGLMTLAGATFAVGPGAVTWQGIGQDHGIYNPGPQPLDFLRLAVSQPGQTFTTIDRHDDLRQRRP